MTSAENDTAFSVSGSESPTSSLSSRRPLMLVRDDSSPLDTVSHTPQANDESSLLQGSARTAPGEALTLQGGFDGELAGMLQRLALEGVSLDESILRSVRRVLQLGTVLTGQRLSEEEIRALPTIVFDAAEQQNCPICLEVYQRGEFLTSLQCAHFFHVDCLARWFQRSTQCPLCRSQCVD